MKKKIRYATSILIVLGLCLMQCCLQQNFRPAPKIIENCVTPIKEISTSVVPNGMSTTPDGSLFGVSRSFGIISLFNNKGEVLWMKEGIGSTYALLINSGLFMLIESYNKKESWKSTIMKLDSEGNVLWEKQTGLIGLDGLAATPDGSFIAVGATDEDKNGHIMLFDGDGNRLWDHKIDGRVETVAVSKTGYVVAGPRDKFIYVYDCNGELIFKHQAKSYYTAQDTAISPDEDFFLFSTEDKYINCYTLHGEFLWQKEVGSLHNVRISPDGEYIAAGTYGDLYLFDRNGNELWNRKVSDGFIDEVSISIDAEYIAVETLRDFYSDAKWYMEVYNKEGELLWKYQDIEPFMSIAMSDDGHYIAAGSETVLVFFDNFQAIEEYALSECGQSMRFLYLN